MASGSFFALSASAATLSISPNFGNYSPGNSFSASVYVSSPGQSVNAFSATVSFPVENLEITGVSKAGSIINFWAQEPSYSNQGGELHFEGLALSPGFTGNSGKLLSINFRVKSIGLAKVSFSLGSVLANDGAGTNVLSDMSGGEYNISTAASNAPSAAVVTTPSIAANSPAAPLIYSSTHPDSSKWYSSGSVKVAWGPLPEGITAVRTLFNKAASSLPTILNDGTLESKDITDVSDGVWYFHVQLKNKKGWGSISHFRINIDTNPPAPFKIVFLSGPESTNPKPVISFTTTDSLSGIQKYQAKIGDGDFFDIPDGAVSANSFALPLQLPGKHSLIIQAIDKAGNSTTAYGDFNILPIASPKITSYSDTIKDGDFQSVEGITSPNSSANIFIAKQGENPEHHIVQSDLNGVFSLLWPKALPPGKYILYAEAMDKDGAVSQNSETHEFTVLPGAIIQIGPIKINNVYLAYFFLLGLLLLVFGGSYGWYINFRHQYKFHRYVRGKKFTELNKKN